MNKILLALAACAAAPFAGAEDQHGNESQTVAAQQIVRAGAQASALGPADYFSGRVRVDPLFAASNKG